MSGYIMDLRKIVGHRTLLQVGASVIVEDENGRALLQKRTDNHCWGYAGGSVELDERVEDAVKRELFEETGLTAEKLELFGVFSGKETHYVYPNGDEVSNVDIVFICREYSGELKMQEEEVEELRFFDAENIPAEISPPIKTALDKWTEMKISGRKRADTE
ncbi:MAG: NUDIX hydrolase [Prevotella sp.]|nr:NUDIX hydrolase [Prevotella sp.]